MIWGLYRLLFWATGPETIACWCITTADCHKGLTWRSRTSPLCFWSHKSCGSPSNSSSLAEASWLPIDQKEILLSCWEIYIYIYLDTPGLPNTAEVPLSKVHNPKAQKYYLCFSDISTTPGAGICLFCVFLDTHSVSNAICVKLGWKFLHCHTEISCCQATVYPLTLPRKR